MSDPGSSGVERKVATVLFADQVGSTAAASGVDPERVRLRLERFYDAMTAEVEALGGSVEKFAGDAVMAAFGVPSAFEDHAERALHAALAMRRRAQELFGDELVLRVGVNSGEVVTGRPREGSSFVSGDVVNVAARLEQAAGPGEILVGERTVAAVRGAFAFSAPERVAARGKEGGVECRRLVAALSLTRPRGVRGLPSVFIGREQELERLRDAYRAVVARREPGLVLVAGDAGVGKTRLVRELWQRLAGQVPSPLLRVGRCLPYGQSAYSPLAEVVKEQFGIGESDSDERVRLLLGRHEVLGVALGLDLIGDLHPLRVRDRFQDAWVELVSEATGERAMVIVIEDLHWSEGPLLDLFEQVLERVRGPLLLVGTARPDFLKSHSGFARDVGETVTVRPLEGGVAQELVERLLGADPPPPLSELVATAEGNPFFVEEVLASLIDQGLLEECIGGWRMDDLPAGFLMPDSVQAVIAARIDLLAPEEKEALQAAAVIGRVFWSGPVYELCSSVDPDLRELEQRGFVRLRAGTSIEGEREYEFKHALTREVAYASIPRARRALQHAAFADWLERMPGRRDEHTSIIAYHFIQATRPEDADLAWEAESEQLRKLRERATDWVLRAAELALGRYEVDEGLAMLHQALEIATSRSVESRIWHAIGRAHALKYESEPFSVAMERAIELSDDPVETAEVYSDLVRETVLRVGMWRKAPDPARIDRWIDRALAQIPAAGATRAKVLIARALWGGTAADAAEANAIAEAGADTDLRFSALAVLASVAFRERDYEGALQWSKQALAIAGSVSDPELVADPDLSAVWPALALGHFDDARRHGARVHELNLGLTPHHQVHAIAVPLEIEELLGQWEEIRSHREQAEAAVEANIDTPCVRNARSLLLCALAEEIAGNRAAASSFIDRAHELRMEGHGLVQEGPLVRLELLRGNLDAVRRLLGEDDLVAKRRTGYHLGRISIRLDALTALRDHRRIEQEAPVHLQPGTYLEPFALRALGILSDDSELIGQAQERFHALGLTWHGAQTEALAHGH